MAVKVLGSCGDGALEAFQREVLCLKALRHANIVQYMGWFKSASRRLEPASLCIVTELCAGTLHDYIHKTPKDPALHTAHRWLYMALDAARGVCFLHGASVVHRDIKPSNCLIGRGGVLKVADFGLSSFMEAGGLPASGPAKGTPGYCAPCVRSCRVLPMPFVASPL